MDPIRAFIALHEAALTHNEIHDALRRAITEALGGESENRWIWLRDVTDVWCVFEDSGSGSPSPGLWRVGYAIDDDGNVTLTGPRVEVVARTIYEPVTTPAPTIEAADDLVGDCIPLVEAVVRRDGTVPIKVIEEGWGTSGYYSADVLKTSGPAAFPAGTQMFWDHPTVSESTERPERSLRDLAAVLESDAYWLDDGPAGPALYADAKVFSDYREAIDELAPHIGVSIRASGRAHLGEAAGKHGRIIDEIVAGKSVDFVTAAGAGGEVLALFESARGSGHHRKEPTVGEQELREANSRLTTDLTEARALGDLAAAERDQLRVDNARLREAQLLGLAREHAATVLAEAKTQLPDVTKARIVESVSANPPAAADGTLDKDAVAARVTEAVKTETEYLAAATGRGTGTVHGLGGAPITEGADAVTDDDLAASFGRLGLSESAAKHAAVGRR